MEGWKGVSRISSPSWIAWDRALAISSSLLCAGLISTSWLHRVKVWGGLTNVRPCLRSACYLRCIVSPDLLVLLHGSCYPCRFTGPPTPAVSLLRLHGANLHPGRVRGRLGASHRCKPLRKRKELH